MLVIHTFLLTLVPSFLGRPHHLMYNKLRLTLHLEGRVRVWRVQHDDWQAM